VDRDTWLLNAIHYVAFGSWTIREWHNVDEAADSLNGIYGAVAKIRQASRDGTLPVWAAKISKQEH
jgi:hypothetical protein